MIAGRVETTHCADAPFVGNRKLASVVVPYSGDGWSVCVRSR
ncbi:hypothetical protein [Halogeometricum borinquense]|nr:hypothetical protein [Halogeometricum borinquense]